MGTFPSGDKVIDVPRIVRLLLHIFIDHFEKATFRLFFLKGCQKSHQLSLHMRLQVVGAEFHLHYPETGVIGVINVHHKPIGDFLEFCAHEFFDW